MYASKNNYYDYLRYKVTEYNTYINFIIMLFVILLFVDVLYTSKSSNTYKNEKKLISFFDSGRIRK